MLHLTSDSLEAWRGRVRGSTRGLTSEQVEHVARRCEEAQRAGNPSSVWHEAAREFGRLDRCQCYPCRKARGEEKAA